MSILVNISPTLERATLDMYYVIEELCATHEEYRNLLIVPSICDATSRAYVIIITRDKAEDVDKLILSYIESSNSIFVMYGNHTIEGIPGPAGISAVIGVAPPTVSPADAELWHTALRDLLNGVLDKHISGVLKPFIERWCKCGGVEPMSSVNDN